MTIAAVRPATPTTLPTTLPAITPAEELLDEGEEEDVDVDEVDEFAVAVTVKGTKLPVTVEAVGAAVGETVADTARIWFCINWPSTIGREDIEATVVIIVPEESDDIVTLVNIVAGPARKLAQPAPRIGPPSAIPGYVNVTQYGEAGAVQSCPRVKDDREGVAATCWLS